MPTASTPKKNKEKPASAWVTKSVRKKGIDAPPAKRRIFNGLTIEQRQAIRKEKLIAAALELYGTQGFYQVKINDICSKAKLTARYFYESFDSAEQLFNAVFEQQVAKLHQEIFVAFMSEEEGQTAKTIAERTVISYLRTIQSDSRMARIIYIDSLLVPDTPDYIKMDVQQRFSSLIQSIIETTVLESKTLSKMGEKAIAGFSGYCTQCCLNWVKCDFDEPIENMAQVILLLSDYFLSILSDESHPLHTQYTVII